MTDRITKTMNALGRVLSMLHSSTVTHDLAHKFGLPYGKTPDQCRDFIAHMEKTARTQMCNDLEQICETAVAASA